MISLYKGDCLKGLESVNDNSVDMLLVDLPYGTTQCKWDTIIDLDIMWKHLNRVCKENAAKVMFAAQPFTSVLTLSNVKDFKYSWVWEKSKATNYLNAKKQPMRAHEDILVFYKKQPTYNPQMVEGEPYNKGTAHRPTDVYGSQTATTVESKDGLRYPRSVQYAKTAESEGKLHPTQKPVKLLEYLIKTYTNENDIVLDITMGSGSTGVAALNLNREFIGMEMDDDYFNIAEGRLKNV